MMNACRSSILVYFLQVVYPWIYALPTLFLNLYLCTRFLKRKEFSHVFYKLFAVYSISMYSQWFFSYFEYIYELKYSTCLLQQFLTKNRVFVGITQFLNAFIDFNGLISIVLISANRLSIVSNPINAHRIWSHWLIYIFTIVLTIAAVLAIPQAYSYAEYKINNGDISVSFPSSCPFIAFDIHFFMHIFTFSLVTIFTIATFIIASCRSAISRHIKERKIVYLGGVLSAVFGIILVFEVLLSEYSPLHHFVPQAIMGGISEAYEIFDDIASCSPVWILLLNDPAVRRQFSREKKPASTVNASRFFPDSNSPSQLPKTINMTV